ncbi:MAG: acyltransferase, partial [Desulfuromonadaceae bacterium]
MTLKISYYRCGGMSIGACWYHPVGDMHSFMSFYQAWTATLAGEAVVTPCQVIDREEYLKAHLPANNKAKPGYRFLSFFGFVRFFVYLLTRAKDQCSLQIYFTPAELAALKAFYMAETGTRLSTNDVVCGHMFSPIAESDTRPKSRMLSVAVDFRKRMALPPNLLGNMITSINLKFDAGSNAAEVATGLRAAVDDFDSHMDYHANHALFSGLGKKADI